VVRKKAGWLAEIRDVEGEPITEAQVKTVGGLMADAVKVDGMNQAIMDRARHDVLHYLFGVTETGRLTKKEASAVIDWLKETDGWGLNEYARQEAAAVLTQISVDGGQQALEI
jgi:hypothetical protein